MSGASSGKRLLIALAAATALAGISPAAAQPAPALSETINGVSVADRMRIQDEMARYSWAIDSGDMDAYLARFWEDGYILHPKPDGSPGRFEGTEGIRGCWVKASRTGRRKPTATSTSSTPPSSPPMATTFALTLTS